MPADTCTVPSGANSTGDLSQERGVGFLAQRQDHGVGLKCLEPPGRLRVPGGIQFHRLDRQFGPVERGDRAQPVDPDPLLLGVLRLLLVRGHLGPGAPVDDQRVVGAEPPGDPRRVHRGVAAAVDGHPAADHRPLALRGAAQERQGVHDSPGIAGRDVHPLGQVRADRYEHRVESALGPLGGQVRYPVPLGEPNPERGDPVQLRIQHVAGQPVGGDAVAHHSTWALTGIPHLDLVPEPGEMVGGRQAARARADDQRPPPGAGRRVAERPAAVPGEIAQEPLHRVDGDRAVQAGPVADALAGVVADPPVDRGQRVVGDKLPPGLLVPAGLRMRQPRLDVLPGRAPGVARGQQIDVDGALLAHRPGPPAPVQQVRQRRHIRRVHRVSQHT